MQGLPGGCLATTTLEVRTCPQLVLEWLSGEQHKCLHAREKNGFRILEQESGSICRGRNFASIHLKRTNFWDRVLMRTKGDLIS